MAETIVIYGGKGGAGKTTTAYNLGKMLEQQGVRVLFVDFDGGQASLSALAGVNVAQLDYGLYEAINDSILSKEGMPDPKSPAFRQVLTKIARCVRWLDSSKRSAILANNLLLAAMETEMVEVPGREYILKRFLANFAPRFDYIIIDPPANRGLLTINTLVAADWLVVPVEVSSLGFQATASMLAHPQFLPRITGRSWETELQRLGLSRDKWTELAPFRNTTTSQPTNTPTSMAEEAEADEFLAALNQAEAQTPALLPYHLNNKLRIAAVIPSMYNPDLADSRRVLSKLTGIFGELPRFDTEQNCYLSPAGTELLMPPVPYSGTYRRGYGLRLAEAEGELEAAEAAPDLLPTKAAHELDSRHRPVWEYIAQHLIELTAAQTQPKTATGGGSGAGEEGTNKTVSARERIAAVRREVQGGHSNNSGESNRLVALG